MKIVVETTEWSVPTPNHVYVLNDSMTKMTAYVPAGSKILKKFSKPMGFDTRGRTFAELEDGEPDRPDPDTWQVPGSGGKTYTVSRELGGGLNYHCTCPGFTYRGSCKHTAEFIAQHQYDVR